MAELPSTLPQFLDQDGYTETPPKLMIRTQMEAGVPKRRRRFSSGVRPIKGQMILTFEETQILDDFFNITLSGGSNVFDWVHPRTQQPCVMGFVTEPQYTPQGAAFNASLDLEIMP